MDPASLPIRAHAKEILEAVRGSSVVVVIGDAGSGKTTQIPQILAKAGYGDDGKIVVTQPRRLAAISAARRVSEEMGVRLGAEVGYAVRFEEDTSSKTVIKYVTDGLLLRECLADTELSQYSVVMLDEAHERSLNTDILFGVLKSLVNSRKQALKLLITSATLDGKKFSEYFMNCPILNVPGVCFPVEIIHTMEDHVSNYMQAAMDVVLDLHVNQPPGDILVFLTGQAEIQKAVELLNKAVADLPEDTCDALQVLPLYAALPMEQQSLVFSPTPEGCRRCVVATNIAETSITVNNVVYVVDPGTVKQKSYNPLTGMGSLEVVTISHVQAKQRAGRAGRTQPGKCYRLYTKKFHDKEMADITLPEIQRTSLTSAVLYLKTLPLAIDVLRFDYLDAPKMEALEDALRQLYVLGAIDIDGKITTLGEQMAQLPVEPSLARALIASMECRCLDEMVIVAAMLSAENIFEDTGGPPDRDAAGRSRGKSEQEDNAVTRLAREGLGDHVLLLRIYQEWERAGFAPGWCRRGGLSVRSMRRARDIHKQLKANVRDLRRRVAGRDETRRSEKGSKKRGRHSDAPHEHSCEERGRSLDAQSALRKAVCVGFANRLAHRMAAHNGYRPLAPGAPLSQLHPSSARVSADSDGLLPEWIVYHECFGLSRPFLRQVCPVDDEWVQPLLPKMRNIEVKRLSGGASEPAGSACPKPAVSSGGADGALPQPALPARRNDDNAVEAARRRYLERKAGKRRK
ncbi:unnamed protein product [Ostreobium quekettii]|uniref:RNA helicase n=1 Tax=Ostreobium quekettii TaxID=121088 RepID=A0A8S1J0H8_9CHLO|nr:unnamed protein product [Ostreobium quekettii]|eukprot:evm.model.scf_122.6 EVM.evm.TU.scf_122.6   scf_122:21758-29283(-)